MTQTENWQSKARQALMQDPKKTSVMGALLLVLLFMGGRVILPGNSRPNLAVGNIVVPSSSIIPAAIPLSASSSGRSDNALRDWLSQPAPPLTRNDFLVHVDSFPVDPAHPGSGLADGSFWKELEKSLSVQADQQDQRQSAVAAIQKEAESIRPASILTGTIGSRPRAMVNGSLLAEGDTIDGFCLLKIEARGIIVERDGVKLAVPLR